MPFCSAQLDFIGVLLEKPLHQQISTGIYPKRDHIACVYCTTVPSYHPMGGCAVQGHVTLVLRSSPEWNEIALKVTRSTEHESV